MDRILHHVFDRSRPHGRGRAPDQDIGKYHDVATQRMLEPLNPMRIAQQTGLVRRARTGVCGHTNELRARRRGNRQCALPIAAQDVDPQRQIKLGAHMAGQRGQKSNGFRGNAFRIVRSVAGILEQHDIQAE